MWSDPIADMLTRIRNAVDVRKREVRIPASNIKIGIAEVLKSEGYIRDYDRIDDGKQGVLRVFLKYSPAGEAVIHELKRASKPGRRVHRGTDDIPKVLNGMGISVLSTSHGILSDRQCREKHIGGELLCTVS
jgi:small subunit ribosomal protein S8